MTLSLIAHPASDADPSEIDMTAIYQRIDRVFETSHPLVVEMANGTDTLLFGLVHNQRIKARTTRAGQGVEGLFSDWEAIDVPEKVAVIDAHGAFACTTEFFMNCMVSNIDLPVTADVAAAILGTTPQEVLEAYEPDATFRLDRRPRDKTAGAHPAGVDHSRSLPVYSFTRCLAWLMQLAMENNTGAARAAA